MSKFTLLLSLVLADDMNGFTTSERSRAQAWLIEEINDDVPKYMFEGTDNAPDCHNPLPDTNAIYNKVF